jgi:integrase
MLPKKFIRKPYAGKPHVRIDEGEGRLISTKNPQSSEFQVFISKINVYKKSGTDKYRQKIVFMKNVLSVSQLNKTKKKKMARRKKEIVMPHLNDCGGDMTKKWYVEYSLRNPKTGKMERVRTYDAINRHSTATERYVQAKELIAKYTSEIRSGKITHQEFVEYEDMLLYDGQGSFSRQRSAKPGSIRIYLSEFLKAKQSEVSTKSMQTYISKMRLFCIYAEQRKSINKPVTEYTPEFIADFLRDMVAQKTLSRVTIRKYEQILHTFFDYLKTKKTITQNPVTDMPRVGAIKDEAPAAIPAYMRKILQEKIEQSDPQLWMFICFQYYTAIRPGVELRLMKLHQINYGSKTITIQNFLSKNNRTETIDIPDQLFDMIINKWKLNRYDQNHYIFGKFHTPGDDCLGKNNMRNRFNAFRKKLKLPHSIKLYSWKHSGAQELADNATSIYEIQRHLRHRDITTTEQYLKKRIGQRSSAIKHNFPNI